MIEDDPPESAHLDARRIARLAAGRRAMYRSRSYAIIASAACAVGAGEVVYWIFQPGAAWMKFAYPLIAFLLFWAAWKFFRIALKLHHQAREGLDSVPTASPDFSKLGDGSQLAKNLENISDDSDR